MILVLFWSHHLIRSGCWLIEIHTKRFHIRLPFPSEITAADMAEIMIKLLSCDYPFQWQPKFLLEIVPDDMVHRLTDQLNEKIFEDDFHFEHLMLYIGLSYELSTNGEVSEAMKIFETGENKLKEFIQSLPASMNQAAQHIMSATKARLLLQQGNLDDTIKVLSESPSVDSMNTENRAALYGFQAVFFDEYGISGTKRALELAAKAIDLSPDEPMWYFLKGKYLGRLRRVERPYDVPGAEEIELLKKANQARGNPSFLAFTAQMYCETASRIYRAHAMAQLLYPTTKLLVDNLNRKSLNLYNDAVQLKPNCSHMMFRCARGFIKLLALMPDDEQYLKRRAKTLLDEGLKKAPENGYGNHVMAQYYERIKKDEIKAIKFLKICEKQRIFGAVMDLIRLEYRSGQPMSLVDRLMDLLTLYQETSRKCQVYSQVISYQVFVLGKLENACENTYTIMKLDPHSDNLRKHRAICLRGYRKTVNLYKILIDEIKIRMQDRKPSEDQMNYYRKFLNDLLLIGLSVSVCKPQYLKNEILSVSVARPRESRSISRVSSRRRPKENRKKNLKIPSYVGVMAAGSPAYHKTDVDKSVDEIFNRCVQALEKDKKNKRDAFRQTDLCEDWRSVPVPTKGEYDDSENRVKNAVCFSGPAGRSSESDGDGDDDDAYRMIIYKKMKAKSDRVCRNSYEAAMDASEDIVSPLQKLKIVDQLPNHSDSISGSGAESKCAVSQREPKYDSKELEENRSGDSETPSTDEDECYDDETVLRSTDDESDGNCNSTIQKTSIRRPNRKTKFVPLERAGNASFDIVTPLKKLRIKE